MADTPSENSSALSTDEAFELFSVFPQEASLLLAVSGGPDSLAMMQLAVMAIGRGAGFELSAATVDHGLRSQSAAEAESVAASAMRLGVPHQTLIWEGEKPKTRLQEMARNARYDLLSSHARSIGADHVLTAHTLDDQAETILFRMARGSGISGLVGMRSSVQRGAITHSRPLLQIAKERLVDTCKANDLLFVTDLSNENRAFARVRFRQFLPLLASEGLTAARFADLSRRANRAEEALEARVDQLLPQMESADDKVPKTYRFGPVCDEPSEIILRLLLRIIRNSRSQSQFGQEQSHLRLNRVEVILDEFKHALRNGLNWRRSLSGLVIQLDAKGVLSTRIDPRMNGRERSKMDTALL